MKYFFFVLIALISLNTGYKESSVEERSLKVVNFQSRGYDLGLQHGKTLSKEIDDILKAWKENTQAALNKNPDEVIDTFLNMPISVHQ